MPATHNKIPFFYIQLCCVAIVAAMLYIFPGAEPAGQLLKLIGVWFIADYAYRRLCATNIAGRVALLAAWTLLAAGVTLNIWYFTTASGGTPENPVLFNDDAATAWREMSAALNGDTSDTHITRRGYGLFLAILSWGGTPSIDGLLDINMLAILIAIVLAAASMPAICGVVDNRLKARACTTGIILLASTSYFMVSGTILIKDAMCCLLTSTVLYTIYACRNDALRYTLISVSIAAATLIRPNILAFFIVAIVLGLIGTPKRRIVPMACLCMIIVALYIWQLQMGSAAPPVDTSDGTTNFILTPDGAPASRLEAYSAVSGDYDALGTFRKILVLPFSLAVQFLTPLPWAWSRDAVFGPAVSWAHFSFPWYALGGILFYYLFFCFRRSPLLCQTAFAFGLIAWVLTAFITGGTVSRYCLPWLPFLCSGAVWIITSGRWRNKSFKVWSIAYVIALAAGLAAVFICLNIYSPGGWEAA